MGKTGVDSWALTDGRLGEYLTDQRLDGLLYALERDHLRDQQVHHIALDPWAVRQRENKVGLRTRRPVIWESSTEQQRACEVVA